jgi:hypothetical protein
VENIEDSPKGSDIQGLAADLLEAARVGIFRLTVSQRTSAPGHDFLPGRCGKFRSPESSFPCLGSVSVLGQREERGKPQTDPCRAFLCLEALGLEESFCQDRSSAPQRTSDPLPPSCGHPAAPRLPQIPQEWLRLGSSVPPRDTSRKGKREYYVR